MIYLTFYVFYNIGAYNSHLCNNFNFNEKYNYFDNHINLNLEHKY